MLWQASMPDSLAATAPEIDTSLLELSIHARTNAARTDMGLSTLAWSDEIANVARDHSEDMARKAYFGHINAGGESATERAARHGFFSVHPTNRYVIVGIGENLFATHRFEEYTVHHKGAASARYEVTWKRPEQIAYEAVEAWLKSPTHRRNLLSTTYSVEGIGVAIGNNGTIFVTQNFN